MKNIYTKGECRSIVSQAEVDNVARDVLTDTRNRFHALGEKRFCSGNEDAYYALANTEKVPKFAQHEDYAAVREKMLHAGWEPLHSETADTCTNDDARCQGRPEMESCAGTGEGNCKFIWKRSCRQIAICTVGDPALYDGVC